MLEAIIAVLGLGVGDYIDPLNLNTEDDKQSVIVQESCESTTTINEQGQETTVKSCKTMKTINTNEEKD
jgi:hypothetical protein